MKSFFLFQKQIDSQWTLTQKILFWVWNITMVVGSGVGIGCVSLLFAPVANRGEMMKSYFQISWLAFLNIAPVVLLVVGIYLLTNRSWIAYVVTSVAVLALSISSWFKMQFRNDPVLFEDILLIKEAMKMAGQYQVFLTTTIVLAVALAVLGTAALFFTARGRLHLWARGTGLIVVVLLAFPLGNLIADDEMYNVTTANNEWINQWSTTDVYTSKGLVYPFLHSAKNAFGTPPEGYDENRAESLLAEYTDENIPENQKVNVISLMLEAYNDFSRHENLELNPEVYEIFHQLESEGVAGNLVTNVFAANTIVTERNFLTGYSQLPSFRGLTNSYPWYFQDQGYYTTGAHGCYNWFYNRLNVNDLIGFNDYYYVENYFAPMTGGNVAYDAIFFPALIDIWEERPKDQPFFSYNLSYQGHGPYDSDVTWFGDDNVVDQGYTQEELNVLNNYFGSIRDTNNHLETFFDYYRQEQEPVVIVMYGDHNPWLGDGNSLYHLLGINLDVSTPDGFYNYYSTRYLIWANDAAKEILGQEVQGVGPDISPNFLMAELFSQCGWLGTASMQAAEEIKNAVPVINTGSWIYGENGTITRELSPENAQLLENFDFIQHYDKQNFKYNHLVK